MFTILLLYWSCEASHSNTQNDTINDEEIEIAKGLIQGSFDDLWAGCDSTKISDYHTDDFIILENGAVWTNDNIRSYMRDQLANPNRAKRINKMDYISIDKYGPSIQLAYHNYAEFYRADTLSGKGSWLESALAVPTENGWKLKMMHHRRAKRAHSQK